MSQEMLPEQLPRNLETEAIHKREVFWQIYAPMFLALVVALSVCALAVGAATGGGAAVSGVWANVLLVLIVLQLLLVLLPLLVLYIALIYLTLELLRYAPPYFKMAQDFTAKVAAQTKIVANVIAEPMVAMRSAIEALQEITKQQMSRGGKHE